MNHNTTLNQASTPSGDYKEGHAISHNYAQRPEQICRGGACLWAKCEKDIRTKCPAHLWAVVEYERLAKEGRYLPNEEEKPKPVQDERSEHREFLRELGKGVRYVGFGDEEANCGRWGMVKECENGHWIMKRLVCGREWCPNCGQDDSEHHKRRISRLVDRVFSMDSVGYFVFEVPLRLRSHFEDVGMFRAASNYLSRMLSREGFPKGVRRWHFYGEAEIKEDGKLDLSKYHPHLNCLCQGGYIGKKRLKRIRRLWSRWLKVNCGQKQSRTAPVYYQYKRNPGKKWHWLRYITRSTFKELTDGNRHIASDLFQFKNTSWFGVFTEEDKARGRERFEVWLASLPERERHDAVDVAAHDAYESGLCPVCGAATELVEGVVKCDDYVIEVDYGGGLYWVHAPPELEPSYKVFEDLMGIGCRLW